MGRKPNLERRQDILAVATRLIHEHGMRGVSMDDIAASVGVRKANLFHYFPTKDALVLAAFDQATEPLRADIQAHLGRPGAADDPVATIEAIFAGATNGMRQTGCSQGCLVGNLTQEMADHSKPIRQRSAAFFRFWQDEITVLLLKSRRRGLFRREFDAGVAAEAIVSLYEGAMLQSKAFKNVTVVRNAGRVAARYLQGYLATEEPARASRSRRRK